MYIYKGTEVSNIHNTFIRKCVYVHVMYNVYVRPTPQPARSRLANRGGGRNCKTCLGKITVRLLQRKGKGARHHLHKIYIYLLEYV